MFTPLGMMRYSPGKRLEMNSRADSLTTILTERLSTTLPAMCDRILYGSDRRPAAWKVPTTGEVATITAAGVIEGVQGSCACSRSKCWCSRSLSMRCIINGHTFTWALEPLERNGIAVPAEMNRSGTGKSGRGRDKRAQRRDDPRLVALGLEPRRQVLDVVVHAARDRPRVGRDQRDPHATPPSGRRVRRRRVELRRPRFPVVDQPLPRHLGIAQRTPVTVAAQTRRDDEGDQRRGPPHLAPRAPQQ